MFMISQSSNNTGTRIYKRVKNQFIYQQQYIVLNDILKTYSTKLQFKKSQTKESLEIFL